MRRLAQHDLERAETDALERALRMVVAAGRAADDAKIIACAQRPRRDGETDGQYRRRLVMAIMRGEKLLARSQSEARRVRCSGNLIVHCTECGRDVSGRMVRGTRRGEGDAHPYPHKEPSGGRPCRGHERPGEVRP